MCRLHGHYKNVLNQKITEVVEFEYLLVREYEMVQPCGKQCGLMGWAQGFARVPKGTTGGFKLS